MYGLEVEKSLAGANGQLSAAGFEDDVRFAERVALLNEQLVCDANQRRTAILASLLA